MIKFYKMQAIGNDFVIIDCRNDYPRYNFNILSKFLCDRKFGIGADGVIYFYYSKIAEIKMRIFNSDGTEAEMCGNGIRCLAKLLYDKKILERKNFKIETLAGIKEINLEFDNKVLNKIEVNMGKVIFDPKIIPVFLAQNNLNEKVSKVEIDYNNKIFDFYPVSVGNPHAVCFVGDFKSFEFEKLGAYVESYKYFPKKTNVEFVKIENSSKLKVKVWERGCGTTLGCGTGAIAAAAITMEKLSTNNELIVDLDGGKVEVKKKDENYLLIGDADFVYEGKIYSL